MKYLYLLTITSVLLSAYADRARTVRAVRLAFERFKSIASVFCIMIVTVSFTLYFISDRFIMSTLGSGNTSVALLLGALLGSISVMPGFIAFPLASVLLKKGVGVMVVSAFTSTLMMVGVVTSPVEKKYFGARVTVIRNIFGFLIAVVVAIVTGICYGETPW
jgi:uncharacterized membrane protein YraQ (UPF0718 family)